MQNSTKITPYVLAILLLCSATMQANGQEMIFRNAEDGSVAMLSIPGGMLLVEGNDAARVSRRIVPTAGNETPDIQEGDLIIFVDGQRIASTDQLRTLYDEIAIDAEVKLGIQRGENKMIRSFIKPETQSSYSDDSGGRVMRFEMAGPEGMNMAGLENQGLWPAGFIVGEKDGEVVVGGSIPLPNKAEALSGVESGYIIVSLNGTAITSVESLNATYDALQVGDDVTLEVRSDSGVEQLMFKKPEPPRMRMNVRSN